MAMQTGRAGGLQRTGTWATPCVVPFAVAPGLATCASASGALTCVTRAEAREALAFGVSSSWNAPFRNLLTVL